MAKNLHHYIDDDFDPILSSQFFDKAVVKEPISFEQKLAWRKLHRDVCDAISGTPEMRLIYITEIEEWIEADDAVYPFAFWCEGLQLEPSYVKRFFKSFLQRQRQDAMFNAAGIKTVLNDGIQWFLQGQKGPGKRRAHLPQRISTECFGCLRCQKVAESLTEFEDDVCEVEDDSH